MNTRIIRIGIAGCIGAGVYLLSIATEKAIGQAWDNGYKTGREAEREGWNHPTSR